MYSDVTNYTFGTDQCGTYGVEGDCYNREHSVPKSWFSEQSPMKSDVWHVYPTDGKINGMRSNNPFGEVGSGASSSKNGFSQWAVSYTHLRAHETGRNLVCRLLLEKKKRLLLEKKR